jgi:hypothetical protein
MNMRNFFRIMVAVALTMMWIAGIGGVAVAANGSITGHVYEDGGITPIHAARVVAYDWNTGLLMGEDTTNSQGVYSILGLQPGSYRVKAEAGGHVAEYYDGVTTAGGASLVQVADGTATALIDFTLTVGSTISGTVYLEDGTTPLISQVAHIMAYDNLTGTLVGDGYSSDVDGTYSVTTGTEAATYRVMAEARGYGPEYFDNVTTFGAATQVSVDAPPFDYPGVDFSLAPSGFISGHVYRDDGETPITNALITVYDNATVNGVADAHSGTYDNAPYYVNLAPGSYRLKAEATGYLTQWYYDFTVPSGEVPLAHWSSASTVTVDTTEVPDIDFSLPTVEAVATDLATDITYSSATLNGDLTSMGAATSVTVSFLWGTASGALTSETTPGEAMTAPGLFHYDMVGLAPGITYYYQAKAVGDDITTVLGEERSFTTVAIAPPTVTTGGATNLTTTSATLNGDLTALGTAASDNVSFEWGITTSYGSETTPQSMSATGSFSDNLTGLTEKTTYHFRAKAVGDDTATGLDAVFTTSSIALEVATGASTNLTTTSATLNGSLTGLGTATTDNVSFEWGTTTSYGSETTPQSMSATGSFSDNLTGLTAKTTYHFRAKAVGDTTAYGDDATFTTSTVSPSVTTSTATNPGGASATVNGNLAALGTATTVSVSFQWGATASYGSETTAQAISAIGTFSANLTGLTDKTTYHFRAKAVGDGDGVYGDDMTFTTLDATAPVISVVNSSGFTKKGATITWTTNEAATSQVQYGLTEEYGSTTDEDSALVTSHSVDLSGLKAGKTYHYSVISKDAAGNQQVSPDKTFKTESSSGGMPGWSWALIGLAIVGALGGGAYFLFLKLAKK